MADIDISKATPRPWSYDPKINRIYSTVNDRCVATPHIPGNCDPEWPHDAALIVRAGNRDHLFEEMVEVLQGIRQYANDTLSGRADGPDDRDWHRAGIIEIRNRARNILAKVQQP